jgi:tetratricopeptide (TPR) repeat protein
MKAFKISLTILSLSLVFISFKVFESMKLQVAIIEEFNNHTYKDETLQMVLNMDYSFPNITVTTLSMSDIVARYYFLSENFEEALKILDNKQTSNPYLFSREILKAEIFAYLKVNDSALSYSKIAFNNMPNNPFYFETVARQFNIARQKDSIIKYYNRIPEKNQLGNFKSILSLFSVDSISSAEIKQIAKNAKKIFPSDKTIQVLGDYTLYGSSNVKLAVESSLNASQLVKESKYKEASELYIKSASLNPSDYTYFENAGYTLGLIGKHEEAIPYLSQVVDSLNPGTGKSEFLLGYSYGQLGQNELACKYLRKSIKLNFQPAYQEFNNVCK